MWPFQLMNEVLIISNFGRKTKPRVILFKEFPLPCFSLRNKHFTGINQPNLWKENLAYEMKNWIKISKRKEKIICHKCANNTSLKCNSLSVFFSEFILWRQAARLQFLMQSDDKQPSNSYTLSLSGLSEWVERCPKTTDFFCTWKWGVREDPCKDFRCSTGILP